MVRSLMDDPNPAVARRADGAGAREHRLLLVAVAVVTGALSVMVAVLAALVSRMVWRPGAVSVPWGLALAVAASVAVVLVARTYSRALAFVAAGVWIVATGLVLAGRPEGDYVFAQDALGLGYLLVAAIAVISAAAAGGPR